jgi:hypothetical protein
VEQAAEEAKKAAITNKVITLSCAFYEELKHVAAELGDVHPLYTISDSPPLSSMSLRRKMHC